MTESEGRLYVGVDWATDSHQVCTLDASGTVVDERAVRHDAAGLDALCSWLLEQGDGQPETIWVGIEVPHGAVVETLLERGFMVHSINPKQMDRFRDRFTVAGAKDDRRDALVIADSLRTDPQCYRRLQIDEPVVIELREWSRMAEELRDERNRLANRLRQQLRRYYPQFLELGLDVDGDAALALWDVAPTPAKARRIRPRTVARVLKSHRIRKIGAEDALEILRRPALVVAPGTVEAATAHIGLLAERLRVIIRQVRDCHRRLDALFDRLTVATAADENAPGMKCEQRDVEILRSLPGVGRIVLAVLLAEAWWALVARDYHALRALSGVAPVTRASGKRRRVVMRQACNPRLRRALYHWARVAMQKDPVSRAKYQALRARGHSHGRALRSVADRLLGVACAMLRDGATYDPVRRVVDQHRNAA